ncbi:unnamed protein product [Scytosiphon promiscuus]
MEKAEGWERVSELSRILQYFRQLYVRGESEPEEDHPALLDWRQRLLSFLKKLLLSCELNAREDGDWIHFRFDGPFSKILGHSCCDWSSPDALGCGLMAEVVRALLQVQSELPVCTTAIVHVLLHRLAIVRPGKETKQPFFALISALQGALDACPALPSLALAASVEDCLRKPSPGAAAWSLRATRMFVGGVLSLVSRSPRSLCLAVVSVLVRFVAQRRCEIKDASVVAGDSAEGEQPGVRRRSPCLSCAAAGVPLDSAATPQAGETRTPRCNAQEKRDLVLEGVLRWAVDAHFRRCSRQLQLSINRAVCDGVQQALDAPELSSGHASPPCFPPGCRLLLSFVGGLAGDGGSQIASFLRERCGSELRLFLARVGSTPPPSGAVGPRCSGPTSRAPLNAATSTSRTVVRRRRPVFPVLDAYVGHLCLCRHVSGPLAGRHLAWLARQSLGVLRLLERRPEGGDVAALLTSLSHAIALVLTRPQRAGSGKNSATTVLESSGSLLEIVFDSDARPLSGVPRPLAEAAVSVLKRCGHLQLTRPDQLLRLPMLEEPSHSRREEANVSRLESRGKQASREIGSDAAVLEVESDGGSFADRVGFRRASVAFRNSWSLAAAGIDTQLPLFNRKRTFDDSRDGGGEGGSMDSDSSCDVDTDSEDATTGLVAGNGWGRVPDEVTLRIFSFMTPKRVCRLACVDRAWRELLMVPKVWRPFFEARWPVTPIDVEEDLVGVTERLVAEGLGSNREGKSKRKRGRAGVVFWRLPEDTSRAQPSRDWMVLYRDRHRAERAARGRSAVKSKFPWLVCPFLGCVCSLKSEFAVKRHLRTHKRRPIKRRIAGPKLVPPEEDARFISRATTQ